MQPQKRERVQNQREYHIILTKYEAVHPTVASENNSKRSASLQLFLMIAAWARHVREFSSTLVWDVYDNRQTNTSLHDISTIYVRHPHDKRILLYENIRVKDEIRRHVAICVRVMHDLCTRIVRVRMTSDGFGYKYPLNDTDMRKRKISESILWQDSLYHRNKKVKTT